MLMDRRNRGLKGIIGAAVASFFVAVACAQPQGPVKVGSIEYRKLATREATEKRMMDLLISSAAHWGKWYMLTPFPYDKEKGPKLADPNPPEEELANMKAGGPGPDPKKEYKRKKATPLKWRPIGEGTVQVVVLISFQVEHVEDVVSGDLLRQLPG